VIDPASRALVLEVILRDGRALLQYTAESVPWTTREKQPVIDKVCALAVEQQASVARLSRYLAKQHAAPATHGSYPSYYTTLNFVGINHLLPHLVKEQQQTSADLEKRLVSLPKGEVHDLLEEHLRLKRRHLEVLGELAQAALAKA
jgi:hypothetical protein